MLREVNHFVAFGTGDEFSQVLSQYGEILEEKAKTMKEAKKRKLFSLDRWYQEELPAVINERREKYITHTELHKLMNWKLTRGKFRPRLLEMVCSNSEDDVRNASAKAFSLLPNVGKAIQALTVLKAVGPATASAILAAGEPETVPFMADEAMMAVELGKPLKYTLPTFLEFADEIDTIVGRLNKGDQKTWTPHRVELALWTYYVGLNLDKTVKFPVSKRGGCNEDGASGKTS